MKYESMIILKPLLPDDIRKTVLKRFEDTVSKMGGKVINSDVWGKRHLAYDIGGHSEGYYVIYSLDLDQAKVEELNKKLKAVKDILRYMTLKMN